MNKFEQTSFQGIDKDTSKSKRQSNLYYNAEHISITDTYGTNKFSVVNEKGTEKLLDIPIVTLSAYNSNLKESDVKVEYKVNDHVSILKADKSYNKKESDISKLGEYFNTDIESYIIGLIPSSKGLTIFTTARQRFDSPKVDFIWYLGLENLQGGANLKLLYVGDLNFSINSPITGFYNYENTKIQKVYWIDRRNQLRFINIADDDSLLNKPNTYFDVVNEIELSQPIIVDKRAGGEQTTGMVQYAYTLFNLNGGESNVSSFTDLISLDKGNIGGGEVDELLGQAPVVKIPYVDNNFTHFRLYKIKYTSLNQIPSIHLISEREISKDNLEILDLGQEIDTLTLEELVLPRNTTIIPDNINPIKNRLIISSYTEKSFKLPKTFDSRAYSYLEGSDESIIIDRVGDYNSFEGAIPTEDGESINVPDDYRIPEKHSSINKNYDTYRYQKNSTTLGGEGKYIKYELVPRSDSEVKDFIKSEDKYIDFDQLQYFKNNELYRIGILFYNNLGQKTSPYWIADTKVINNDPTTKYSLKVSFKDNFYNLFNVLRGNEKPVGYKILRARRYEKDRTIIAQGTLSSMVLQLKSKTKVKDLNREYLFNDLYTLGTDAQDDNIKYPSWLIRHGEDFWGENSNLPNDALKIGGVLNRNKHLNPLNNEVYDAQIGKHRYQFSWVYDKMMQFYSPEVTFDFTKSLSSNMGIKVLGKYSKTDLKVWYKKFNIETEKEEGTAKLKDIFQTFSDSDSENVINDGTNFNEYGELGDSFGTIKAPLGLEFIGGTPKNRPNDNGYVGFITPSGNEKLTSIKRYYRNYSEFKPVQDKFIYNIYGTPEISEIGSGTTSYNNDGRYSYSNSFQSIVSDRYGTNTPSINSVNSYGEKNITLVLGNEDTDTNERMGLDHLYTDADTAGSGNGIILVDFIKSEGFEYLGSIYGGNNYEDKKRTDYVEIGDYKTISGVEEEDSIDIISPGDTYIQNFRLMRVGPTDTVVWDSDRMSIVDIIEFPVETSVNLKNRNDSSKGSWDNEFIPKFQDFHKYNKVYSQQSSLVVNRDLDFKFKEINEFKETITASMNKIPNESVDSWTKILPNETLHLDGTHGGINATNIYENKLIVFQDSGIAQVEVSPRVLIQAEDTTSLEIGKGDILNDFVYLSYTSGTLNRFGTVLGERGIYYYDTLNKSLNRFPDALNIPLSKLKNNDTLFKDKFNPRDIAVNNPYLNKGVVLTRDTESKNIFTTIHQVKPVSGLIMDNPFMPSLDNNEDMSFTSTFNEEIDRFVDEKLYYLNSFNAINNSKVVSIDNKSLHLYGEGEYNKYFGIYIPSTITLLINPASNFSTVFSNIHFNSEVYLNDLDQPEVTLSHIEAWNEYQQSGKIPLKIGRRGNIRRRFREWTASVPRDGRERMRNPWIFLKLHFDNEDNYRLVLHDILVKYMI